MDNEWEINSKDIPWYLNISPEGVMCCVSSVNEIPKDCSTFRIYSCRPDQYLPCSVRFGFKMEVRFFIVYKKVSV